MGADAASKVTPFQRRVYDLISTIPKGKVSTYGDVAKALGSCARPVGGALRRNPFAPEVPCHRVVSSARSIGGFSGSIGDCADTRRKRAMLEREGVLFEGDKVSKSSLHDFAPTKAKVEVKGEEEKGQGQLKVKDNPEARGQLKRKPAVSARATQRDSGEVKRRRLG